MNKEGNIDLERISGSIETLSSIENLVNLVDLAENFEDMEKSFRQINFEHSNCLNYKESLQLIYSDIDFVKRKINELAEALRRTKANYTNISSFSEEDIKEFTNIYKSTPASEGLAKLVGTNEQFSLKSKITTAFATQITDNNEMQTMTEPNYNQPNYNQNNNNGNVTTIPTPDTTPQTTKEPIDTLPIGIAIGATGIAGSIGAVIVDDIYRKKEKKQKYTSKNDIYFEEYNEDDILEEDYDYDQIRKDPGIAQGPYRAARLEREADRFYGNQLDKFNLLDDDEDEYLEDDDTSYDDF